MFFHTLFYSYYIYYYVFLKDNTIYFYFAAIPDKCCSRSRQYYYMLHVLSIVEVSTRIDLVGMWRMSWTYRHSVTVILPPGLLQPTF